MKKLLLALSLWLGLAASAYGQNPQCPTRPDADNSNACANTSWVQSRISNAFATFAAQPHTWTALQTFEAQLRVTDPGPSWSTWTNMYNVLRVGVNGYPVSAQFGGNTTGVAEAITGAIEIPSTAAAGNHSAGVAGYARSASTTQGAVGTFGMGSITADNTFGAWGGNFLVTNNGIQAPSTSSGFSAAQMYGVEIDINLSSLPGDVAPNIPVRGIYIIGGSNIASAHPTTHGIDIASPGALQVPPIKWARAVNTEDGAATVGLMLGTQEATGVSASQVINARARDSGGTVYTGLVALDSGANWVYQPGTGGGHSFTDASATTLFRVDPSYTNTTVPARTVGGQSPIALHGTFTNGNAVVTGISPNTTGLAVGDYVLSTASQNSTRIQSVDSSTQITLSQNASASGVRGFQVGKPNPLTQYFFGGGVDVFMGHNATWRTASDTSPDIGSHFVMYSNQGAASGHSAYKVAQFAGMDAVSNTSAPAYVRNDVLNITGTATSFFGTGYEVDVNVPASINQGTGDLGSSTNAIYGLVGVASGQGTMASIFWGIGNHANAAAAGYSLSGQMKANDSVGFFDQSNSQNIMKSTTSHDFGVNLFGATFSTNLAFITPNNASLASANVAGNASIPLIKLDNTDVVTISDGTQDIKLSGRHVRTAGPGAPTLSGTCGTAPSVASNSTDFMGQFTAGTGAAAPCNIDFNTAYTTAPFCAVMPVNGGAIPTMTVTTTQIQMSASVSSGGIYTWICTARTGG